MKEGRIARLFILTGKECAVERKYLCTVLQTSYKPPDTPSYRHNPVKPLSVLSTDSLGVTDLNAGDRISRFMPSGI